MRVAVLGDIHGNLFGLQAALAALRGDAPDTLIVSGDLVYKFPWSAEVVDLLAGLPHQAILGNAELYVLLWATELWPAHWQEPLMIDLVQWERERLGPARLRWLAELPEHVSLSAGRLDDALVVHGAPGNPFLPMLPRPGEDHAPWVQTDSRARQLLNGADADVVICGHTHSVFQRRVRRPDGGETLIASPGSLSYGRGRRKESGRIDYALLDWGQRTGWQATLRAVRYDTRPMYEGLLALDGAFPLAANIANRVRPPGVAEVPEPKPDFIRWRWGDAPLWWDDRDEIPAWRALRGINGTDT
jgi:predicted phosphodiesterase